MRSLFVKIFLSYWAAQALVVVAAILVTLATRPPRQISSVEAQQATFLSEAVKAYQGGGTEVLHHYLRSIHESQHVRLFLFDGKGQDLTGHKPPEWIERVERGETRTADSFWGRMGAERFLRQAMTTEDGQRYILVIELPPEEHPFLGPHGVPGLGIAIAVLSSGLVCFFLARYLTRPVVRLRDATQKLAAGDLSARAGVPKSRRHDEIAELVRDFDTMAERLENLVNAQNRLLHDISHELRSPLARLSVALGLLQQRSGPEAQGALDRIDLEANRLNELIGRLLTIARLEQGGNGAQKVLVELEDLVRQVASDADFEAQSRNCRVAVSIGGQCSIVGVPDLLHSAIENVVRNAVRYTREGTNVEIRLEKAWGTDGSVAALRVSDFGPGVPDESLDKLFVPFYRIDDARGRQTGGVGLGLAITERAVRLHGGSVKAYNRTGGGLTVEIRLPLAAADTAAAREPQTEVPSDHA
ncbi:MAG: HAMP domain-containing protein [Acidobacteriia bacterium]|nr:HAMP domain-containing protein [Terriglobia bacterium]